MTIFDAFTFFNELDILEIRLTELDSVVDRFVLVEATTTHKGDPKPLFFEANKARFAKWLPKIRHVVCDLPGGSGMAAIRRRELSQRNAILQGLYGARPDDLIHISDVDEIPRRECVIHGLEDGHIAVFDQTLYYYNVNTRADDPLRWRGTRAARYADVAALSPHIIRVGMGMPDSEYPKYVLMDNGGWHLSYFGDAEHIKRKMQSFMHQELVTEDVTDLAAIAARVAAGEDAWGRTEQQRFTIGAADDLPRAVRCDPARYAAYFHPDWRPMFHEDWYNAEQAALLGDIASIAPEGGAVVEIGAWEGRSAIAIAQAIQRHGRTLHVVDHWRGNGDEAADHPAALAAAERDVWTTFVQNMEHLTAWNYTPHKQSWRDWIATWHKPIAFLHLDAAHDETSVRDCLNAVKPFLIDGAYLCGDDAYNAGVKAGVTAALGDDVQVFEGRLWVKVWKHGND